MSLTAGFFNSDTGDRKYNAEQISKIFDGVINEGVFASIGTSLVVLADGDDMTVNVGIGKAWLSSMWAINDAILEVPVEAAEVILNRKDMVVLEIDKNTDKREPSIKIIKGTAASIPVNPTPIDTDLIKQLPLAYVYVGANVTAILQSNITNLVGTTACPFVTSILDTITTEGITAIIESEWDTWFNASDAAFDLLVSNWNAWVADTESDQTDTQADWLLEFTTWFNAMKGQLTTDAAGNLQTQINTINNTTIPARALFKKGTGTFSAASTSCVITDAFITVDTMVIVSPTDDKEAMWSVVSSAGYFIITADVAESSDVTFDWGATK